MAAPSTMADLSTTASSNSPQGSESPSAGDDFIRAYGAIIRSTNAKGSDIASASSIDLGAATGEFVDVTGTTTITSLGTVSAGIVRTVRFTGALTLTHNATSLILPGSDNITTASGDCAIFRSLGSGNWKCVGYFKQSGAPVKLSDGSVGTSAIADDAITAEKLADSALGFSLINGTLTASVASNALTIAIKTKAGEDPSSDDPVLCVFRNATLATGDYVVRSITAATSLVISSGSTLGTTNGVQSQINVLAIDNAGTVELAVSNDAGALNLSEANLISTTAEGGAGGADSATTIYSTTARSNVAYRSIGYIVSTQATAGTWATEPSQIQLLSFPKVRGGNIVTGSAIATTSGASIPFSGIPSWAKRVLIHLIGVSASSTSIPSLQLGDAGGLEASGYSGTASNITGGTTTSLNHSSAFLLAQSNTAASVYHGTVELNLVDPANNTWSLSSVLGRSDAASSQISAGTKSLSGPLTQLSIDISTGAYDLGLANITWE